MIAGHEYEEKRKANESEESRQKRLAQQRKNKRKSRASESVKSRQKRLASQSLYQKEKIANESVVDNTDWQINVSMRKKKCK